MIRVTLAVLTGYAVMFAAVYTTLAAAYAILGADRAFRPGTYDASALWLLTSIVLGLAGAVLAGLVCWSVARRGSRATTVLACLVFVLGAAMAVPAYTSTEAPEPRTAQTSNAEAMMKGRTPAFAAVLNPLIGAAGVLAGSKLRRRTPSTSGGRASVSQMALA